ncbi:MAG TPA: hypothetical protein VI277_05010 [Candidatus Limnocylindria bacterium]
MAIIGARPATSPWFGLRRPGSRGRRRPPPASRGIRRKRLASRLRAPTDVRPLLVAIVVTAALAIFYLSQSSSVAARGYEIDGLEAALAEQRAEQQQLVLAIGRARSPSVIAAHARSELNLVPLDPGAVTFAPAPASPAH